MLRVRLASIAAILAIPGQSVVAEEASGVRAIEEIVVTARRREETLQTIPVAITALGGYELEQSNIRTPTDLGRVIPSLAASDGQGTTTSVIYNLRGQVPGDLLPTLSMSVGVYHDGVPIARPVGQNAALFDLERVEVLRGPQGTLYGVNTTGGALNFISRGADFDGIHGYGTVEGGSEDLLRINGAINLPVVDDVLSFRVAAQTYQREGFGKSLVTGQDLGRDRDQQFIRLSGLWRITDQLTAEIKADDLEIRQNGESTVLFSLRELPAALGSPGVLQAAVVDFGFNPLAPDPAALFAAYGALQQIVAANAENPDQSFQQQRVFDEVDANTVGLTLVYDITDEMTLKSTTGYRYMQNYRTFDLDATPYSILEVGVGEPDGFDSIGPFNIPFRPDQESRYLSQELTLSGVSWGGRMNWLVGGFYSTEEAEQTQAFLSTPDLTIAAVGLSLLPAHYAPDIENDNWSIFTQNDFQLNDAWSLTLGLRYTEEEKFLDHRGFIALGQDAVLAPPPAPPVPAGSYTCLSAPFVSGFDSNPDFCQQTNDATFDGWSYLASINWQPTEGMLLYARTARGFRGGGHQLRAPNFPAVEPEFAEDFEIGLKAEFFAGRLQTNLAAYRTDYSDKQESIIVTLGGVSATILNNAADATINGLEFESTWLATDDLTFSFVGSWLDGKYDSFEEALDVLGNPADASGEKLSDPEFRYSIFGRYERQIGPGRLGLQIDYAWVDEINRPDRLRNPFVPDAYYDEVDNDIGLWNARVQYEFLDLGLSIDLFATNLTDEEWFRPGIDESNTGQVQTALLQEPRMWGMSVRKTFGGE